MNWKCEYSMHGRDNFKNLGIDERIILKCVVNKLVQRFGYRFLWLKIGRSG
jgi:hypothetical protein